jgi:hypothetical protein
MKSAGLMTSGIKECAAQADAEHMTIGTRSSPVPVGETAGRVASVYACPEDVDENEMRP